MAPWHRDGRGEDHYDRFFGRSRDGGGSACFELLGFDFILDEQQRHCRQREREREISSSKMFQRGASGAYYPLTEGLETSRNHSSDLELLGAMRGFLP